MSLKEIATGMKGMAKAIAENFNILDLRSGKEIWVGAVLIPTSGTILTLQNDELFSNYSYIEVFFYGTDSVRSSVKMITSETARFAINYSVPNSTGTIIRGAVIQLGAKTLTVVAGMLNNPIAQVFSSSGTPQAPVRADITIYRIIGYKY
jgi:hypothetical protein